ncbi:MAG: SBBP repeat-containing protein [Chitinophagaceae bacterium]|nr:SBBP repeat-containing protein [Chitinophagaceae bacterium]
MTGIMPPPYTSVSDEGRSISIDASGNIIITGNFTGTNDFDPGPAVYNLISSGTNNPDIFIAKLDATGNFVWAKQFGSTFVDGAYSVALDAVGNVYTTGYFFLTVDFDPGPAVYNLTAVGGYNIFVSKLDAAGNFIFAKQIGSGSTEARGQSIKVDASGNIYTTGMFFTTGDFDPGAGIYNLTALGDQDIFVSKLDASGNFLWAKQMGVQIRPLGMQEVRFLLMLQEIFIQQVILAELVILIPDQVFILKPLLIEEMLLFQSLMPEVIFYGWHNLEEPVFGNMMIWAI